MKALLLCGFLWMPLACSPVKDERRAALSTRPDQVLATVGRVQITSDELQSRILDRYYGPRALNGLIREALFSAEAERLGLRVRSEEVLLEVDQRLNALLGETVTDRRQALRELNRRGLSELDLRKELSSEIGQALLIQKVISARREILEEEILELWRQTWKEPRRKVEHVAFPFGDLREGELDRHGEWVARVGERWRKGAPMAEILERPPGLRPSFEPRIGESWLRESDLVGRPLFYRLFEIGRGEVLGPVMEDNFGWHLFRVVEEKAPRPYSEVRDQLDSELRNSPPTDTEVLAVEESLRLRIPVDVRDDAF
ncbi:MAG: peptidylprolyl isomerase [Planctomycetota bacterium]